MILAILADTAAEADKAFPPFDPWHWPSQAFWLIVTFAVLYLVLSRSILPKLQETIERRGNRIANDLDEAAKLNEQAIEANKALELELAAARAKARATAAEAQAEMESEIAAETARTEAAVEEKLAEAEAKISATRQAALEKVEGIATEAAEAIASRLGASVDSNTVAKAVKSALSGQ